MKRQSPQKQPARLLYVTLMPDVLGTRTAHGVRQLRGASPEAEEAHGIRSANIYVQMEYVTLKQLIFSNPPPRCKSTVCKNIPVTLKCANSSDCTL